jgi:hypothetical protein
MSTNILTTQAAMDVALLVDEYRHQHQAIEKYLNQYESRQEMETALTAFYTRQGIVDVTPEMIKAGIEAYEKKRFTYKGVQGNWLVQKVASLYLWAFPYRFAIPFAVAGLIVAPLVTMMLINGASNMAREDQLKELHESISELQGKEESLIAGYSSFIAQSKATLDEVDISHMSYAKNMAVTLKEKSSLQLKAAYSLLDALQNKGPSAFVLGDVSTREGVLQEGIRWGLEYGSPAIDRYNQINESQKAITATMGELKALSTTDAALQRIDASDMYARYKGEVDIITERASVLLSLKSGQGHAANTGASKLEQMLVIKESSKALLAVLSETVPQIKRGFTDESGAKRLESLIGSAKYAAERGDQTGFTKEMTRIRELSHYVMADLNVRIVDKKGIDTGFSRNNDNAKRYYLVLESVDNSGTVYPHEVQNIENGSIERVSHWAQRVSEDEFKRVVADKKADGVVDSYEFGRKPSGDYDIQYSRPTLGTSITRW